MEVYWTVDAICCIHFLINRFASDLFKAGVENLRPSCGWEEAYQKNFIKKTVSCNWCASFLFLVINSFLHVNVSHYVITLAMQHNYTSGNHQ